MATLEMKFTEGCVPAAFRWEKPLSDADFLAFSEQNDPLRFERNREEKSLL